MSLPPPPKGKPIYNVSNTYTMIKDKVNAHVIKYACPCCNVLSNDAVNLGYHIESHCLKLKAHASSEESANEDNCIDDSVGNITSEWNKDMEFKNIAVCSDDIHDLRPEGHISGDSDSFVIEPTLHLEIPTTITPLADQTNKQHRTEQQAIIHACKKQADNENEQNKTIFLVDNLLLRPFAIFDEKGNEENALAHEDVVKRLSFKHPAVQPILPMKRKYLQDNSSSSNTLCAKCIHSTHVDLEELLTASPYRSLLSQREYVPLTDDMSELMNRDWRHYPQVKYFTAVILAGSILLNTKKSQAVMINMVELYGRTKIVDGHREPFGNLKDGIHTTSLPPPLKTIHPGVWPVTLSRNDGPKLVIGTQVSNALVTSSIRLDIELPPSVGGTTSNFNLTITDSFACKIFVDVESATAAKSIISNPATTRVSNTGMISHQLRQIRTRFDLLNTYALCRASGPLTKNHTCHPYTIFTLIDCDRGRNPCAALFDAIGNEILRNGTNAKLMKSTVLSCNENATGKTKEVLQSILDFYDCDDNLLPILFNVNLNRELETLAKLLMPSLVLWNTSVARQIKSVFKYLD